jgi:peptidoglycan/xylan/chitin deacetylase (PgdA/CDA1 family)
LVFFEKVLQLMRREGTPMKLGDLVVAHREGRLPPRAVAITFDDGFRDN